jgi:hypothetical protein
VFDIELLRLAALEQAAEQFGADTPGYKRVLKAMARAAE